MNIFEKNLGRYRTYLSSFPNEVFVNVSDLLTPQK